MYVQKFLIIKVFSKFLINKYEHLFPEIIFFILGDFVFPEQEKLSKNEVKKCKTRRKAGKGINSLLDKYAIKSIKL